MATAIEFEHVSKQYRLGYVNTDALVDDVHRFFVTNVLRKEDPYLKIGETNDRSLKGHSKYVWALRDIDFKVEQGDVVGIIGKNGAGKSTLLKLLSRVTGPTTGSIRAHGRIGSLLEVGTGFHPELTGRENIFMNGAILGMMHQEIQSKLDEIIDFSGCERYIDTPVKRYSSGMTVRLGFAVAAFLEPEILVVDEVLAVGDAEFQKKAIGKMQEVSKGGGRTVLFVSHNMVSIQKLCNTGILLKNGRVAFTGAIDDTIAQYMLSDDDKSLLDFNREGNGRIRFTDIQLCNSEGKKVDTLHTGDELIVKVGYQKNDDVDISKAKISVHIVNALQNDICTFSSSEYRGSLTNSKNSDGCTIHVPHLLLKGGSYNVVLSARLDNGKETCDVAYGVYPFSVIPTDFWEKDKVIDIYPQAMIECFFE